MALSERIAPRSRSFAQGLALVTVLLVALAMLLTACSQTQREVVPSDSAPADPGDLVTVRVVDNAFEPAEVEIEPGQAVRWVFEGSAKHDVVADDGSFMSELMHSGEYIHVFDEPGEWAYICSVHPEMVGQITVK